MLSASLHHGCESSSACKERADIFCIRSTHRYETRDGPGAAQPTRSMGLMDFYAVLDQILAFLRQRRRVVPWMRGAACRCGRARAP